MQEVLGRRALNRALLVRQLLPAFRYVAEYGNLLLAHADRAELTAEGERLLAFAAPNAGDVAVRIAAG